MEIGIVLIAAFAAFILFFIFKYESNRKKNPPRLTGRGGDFES
jgi:hypothetical protein